MKLTGSAVQAFLKSPDPRIHSVLVYGPDEGLVRERLDRLMRHVVDDPQDPFRVTELTAAVLKDDPARLADEAAALSLTGGRRVVRLRDVGDGDAGRLKAVVEAPPGAALLLVQGGDLGARSALRKLFEGAPQAAALPCYADEGQTLETLIRDTLAEAGLAAEPAAVAFLVDHLGEDRGVTRSELAKLVLYCGSTGRVTLADAEACIGDTARLGMDDLALATADGDVPLALRTLGRLIREGVSGVSILRTLIRHFTRLHLIAGRLAAGERLDAILTSLKPPVLFKIVPRVKAEAQAWSVADLGTALDLLLEAEGDLKRSDRSEATTLDRVVLRLAHSRHKTARRPR